MKNLAIGLVAMLLFGTAFSPALGAAQAPAEVEDLLVGQLGAISSNNRQQFIVNGNEAFQDMMNGFLFDAQVRQYGARLRKGYALHYLGAIQRLGMTEYLWRLTISNYRYELFASISLSHGRVVGFKLE